jgi:hypothetical protein
MEVDTEPHPVEQIVEEAVTEQVETQEADAGVDENQSESNEEIQEVKQVPLSVVQKERKKRQEAEAREQRAAIELQYLKEQQQRQTPAAPEDDEDQYESVTKREHSNSLSKTRDEIMRDVEERMWIKANPEKAEFINENLANFLKKKPNLTSAISDSTNRYEEAYLLLNALTPRQQAQLKPAVKKTVAPGSPNSVPKGAALNQAVDVMSMSDSEYREWRNSKKVRR